MMDRQVLHGTIVSQCSCLTCAAAELNGFECTLLMSFWRVVNRSRSC